MDPAGWWVIPGPWRWTQAPRSDVQDLLGWWSMSHSGLPAQPRPGPVLPALTSLCPGEELCAPLGSGLWVLVPGVTRLRYRVYLGPMGPLGVFSFLARSGLGGLSQ